MRASRLRLPESAATIGLGCRNAVDDLTFEDFPPGRFGTFGPPGIAHFGVTGLTRYLQIKVTESFPCSIARTDAWNDFFANAF